MAPFRVEMKASEMRVALRETLAIAVDTLRAHKLRSFLTLLGVILAVATLVAVMSVLNGLNVYVAEKVANLGANAYVIDRVGVVTNFEDWNKARKRPPLQITDLEALAIGNEIGDEYCGRDANVRGCPLWKRFARERDHHRHFAQLCGNSRRGSVYRAIAHGDG